MTRREAIYKYISSLTISLLLALPVSAQRHDPFTEVNDSTPWLNGFAVSADLFGLVQSLVSDYGQYEGALRINLRDQYFPIIELGIGRADHDDDVTRISYSSRAPYGRIGLDLNLMKDKHEDYRIYGGLRYAFSSFKFDLSHPGVTDPIWGNVAEYGAEGAKCNYHWAEAVAGVDAKIWGPIHLGWSVRYRKRLAYSCGDIGNVWYVPGYGKSGSTRLGGTFNISIDI